MNDSYILGLNISHDASAVLINDNGKVIAAISEERLTRQKNHETFPFRSIAWLIEYANIRKDEIVNVAYNWDNIGGSRPYRKHLFTRNAANVDWANKIPLSMSWAVSCDRFLRRRRIYKYFFRNSTDYDYVRTSLIELGLNQVEITAFDHQLCHASSAFYSSGFTNALVISIDGYGDNKSGGIYIGKNGVLIKVEDIPAEFSAGSFYANVTGALGFKRNRHEGKLTGLSASGIPNKFGPLLKRYFHLTRDSQFGNSINKKRSGQQENWNMLKYMFTGRYEYISPLYRSMRAELQAYQDEMQHVAAAAQMVLEKAVVDIIRNRLEQYHLDHLAAAGGVFSNVALNKKISDLDQVKSFFVHPNMGDGGGSFGAAMLAARENQTLTASKIQDVYWGPEFSDEAISAILKEKTVCSKRTDNIEKEIAQRLADGAIVGRFNGRMEYGPRALCNRSILAMPNRKEINKELNNRLGRTEFMPFAPVVLEEYGSELFNDFDETRALSKYMTITLQVRQEWIDRLAAVVHVDQTARPQWVSKSYNPSAYKILNYFYEETGIPALINTSLNSHEEPIVCRPREAIIAWENQYIDVLAIGNYLVE